MNSYVCVVFVVILTLMYIVRGRPMREVLDLSWGIDENTISWPGNRQFEITKRTERISNGQWYTAYEFCIAEHSGTHLDAPYHFNKAGWKVGEIPMKRLIAPGIVIDMRSEVFRFGANTTLQKKHLLDWEHQNGPIPDQSVLLVRFGWSKYYKDKDVYLGVDEVGELNFPGISAEAAKWIADTGKVIGVGVDTASMDPGSSTDFSTHAILANNNIYGLENVNIVFDLPDEMLEAFRGRCGFRQYIKSKPARYGIKIFAVVDSEARYTSNLEVYVGKHPDGNFKVSNSPSEVVKLLITPFSGSGRKFMVDNWFMSFPLAVECLVNHNLTIVGTIRKNKREVPFFWKIEEKIFIQACLASTTAVFH